MISFLTCYCIDLDKLTTRLGGHPQEELGTGGGRTQLYNCKTKVEERSSKVEQRSSKVEQGRAEVEQGRARSSKVSIIVFLCGLQHALGVGS